MNNMIIIKGGNDFYILLGLSIIIITLVLTFNLGKDSDTIYSIVELICNRLYANMYEYCQFGQVYSEILLWGLFSTYCIQTKELQLLFPIIIGLLTLACTIWSYSITIRLLINDAKCFDIIFDYDYLSVYMIFTNFIILNLIFIAIIIITIIYKIKNRNKQNKQNKQNTELDMVELVIK